MSPTILGKGFLLSWPSMRSMISVASAPGLLMFAWYLTGSLVFLVVSGKASVVDSPITGLHAEARDGQVFLMWQEAETPRGTTFNVYLAEEPISEVSRAKQIAHHIESHSARDWWEDPASFSKGVAAAEPVGYRLRAGGERLDPTGGLFVHTVRPGIGGETRLYFAVTSTSPAGVEDRTLVPQANTLIDGIAVQPAPIQPIWQRETPPLSRGAGQGKPLWLSLHGKSGVVADSEYLVFGSSELGWREGLPFRFSVRLEEDRVVVRPTDRTWINRPHSEASDGGANAIWTFWYGYNSKIYDRREMAEGVPTNYTERRLLWMLQWIGDYLEPDPNRWYCSGSSMGGCGTISFGLRHPELFAACHARVPIVSYTYLGTSSAQRLEPSCWIGPIPEELKTNEGEPLLERMDGNRLLQKTKRDLPFLFVLHGRQDGSIPWQNNPPFYRELSLSRTGHAVYWDNETHPRSGKKAPSDVQAWQDAIFRFRLDESYPAFSHTSSDCNAGNGDPTDGDLIGWINRGMDWKDIEDQTDRYAITILAAFPGLEYPIQTDVTLRRLQEFVPSPGEKLEVRIGDAPPIQMAVDERGRITIPKVMIRDAAGTKIALRRTSTR